MKSLAPNTLLQNRYLIVHLIGKGGMGDVYLAVDQRLGSAVALKRTFFSDDEVFGNAFEREARTLARLRHPVLPKVSDHFSENEVQFLVMEHISGDDLSKRLEAAQKAFPLSWVLFWADQLLDALAYMHTHEPPILHRDIKPQNLKLTDENCVILLDFGLSKNTEGDTKPITGGGSTGSVTGYTPHYAPMEQIRGTGTNPRSDIYSLSATLYQLLTNTVPADAITRADSLLNGAEDPVKPLSEINPEVPQPISAVISKGMQLSQEKRFSSAREMQKALRETYAQIQNSMTAQTVAFNLQNELDAEQSGLPDLPAPEKPDVLNIATKKIQSPPPPVDYNSETQRQNLNSLENRNPAQEQNFDATLRIDTPQEDYSKKQSDIKTEVFSGGTSPLSSRSPAETSALNESFAPQETFNGNEIYTSTEDSEKEQFTEEESSYAPEATVPLISVDNQTDYVSNLPDDSALYASPQIEQEADAFATYAPTRDYSQEDFSKANVNQEETKRDEQFNPQPPPARKTSSGRTAAVVGGIFALLVLVLGAGGAGWFVYNKYFAADTVANPTPTPVPTVEFSPTPAPTVETVLETNTNSMSDSNSVSNTNSVNNSNSEVVSSATNSQTNTVSNNSTNSVAGNSRTPQPPPQAGATPKPPPQVAVKNTPKTNPTPAVKPSAKPTTKKPAAPIILQ
jgi:serine/threonine protein kinase